MNRSLVGLALTALLGAAGLTACGTSGSSDGAAVHVVASTNVWADVVNQVVGDLSGSKIKVTSIINDPNADPHSFEANAQNMLALSKADLVVENGGGYDGFVDTMLSTSGNDDVMRLNAVALSGKAGEEQLNEHVWYDFPTVAKVAEQIEAALAAEDPDDAATFEANLAAFKRHLGELEATESSIKSAHAGTGVAITEPVPLYLLEACGLVNKTPEAFSEAVEDDTDVPPLVLKETQELFTQHRVALIAYNEQATGAETEAVLQTAQANKVALVPVSETLPSGMTYVTWMQANLSALAKALS